MGAADVVPGVSGGTMAFILGIYADLIAAIKSFDSVWLLALIRIDVKTVISRPHFAFLIPSRHWPVDSPCFFLPGLSRCRN